MQVAIVALLVAGCACYVVWTLMPSSVRRTLASALLRVPHLPRGVEARLHKSAQAASGCGCDGCDRSEKRSSAPAPAAQTITFHRRARR